MTRSKAEKHYLKTLIHAPIMIKRLMIWDQKLTMAQNANIIQTDTNNARLFAYNMGLKWKKIK